jgi:hypothetical protein
MEYCFYIEAGTRVDFHFDLFERKNLEVKYQITVTPIATGAPLKICTTELDETAVNPVFVPMSSYTTDANIAKVYNLHTD